MEDVQDEVGAAKVLHDKYIDEEKQKKRLFDFLFPAYPRPAKEIVRASGLWNNFIHRAFSDKLLTQVKDGKLIDESGRILGTVITSEPAVLGHPIFNDKEFIAYIRRIMSTRSLIRFVLIEDDVEIYRNYSLTGYYIPFDISFRSCNLSDKFVIKDTVFKGKLSVRNCTIKGTMDILGCTFLNGLSLSEFRDGIEFININNCEIQGKALLGGLKVRTNFKMIETTLSDSLEIRHSTFEGAVDFNSLSTSSEISFENVTFKFSVPNFSGTKITHQTSWTDCNWPGYIKSKTSPRFINSEYFPQRIAAYETLANLMSKLEKHHEKHMFYRLSRRARRETETSRAVKFIDWLYEKSSGYGYKIERVIALWFGVIFAGSIAAFPMKAYDLAMPNLKNIGNGLNAWGDAIAISIANVCGFLGLNRGPLKDFYAQYPQDATIIPFALTWSIQIALGLIIAFLFGLTIRNRFKIG